jgi:hypothetical protein
VAYFCQLKVQASTVALSEFCNAYNIQHLQLMLCHVASRELEVKAQQHLSKHQQQHQPPLLLQRKTGYYVLRSNVQLQQQLLATEQQLATCEQETVVAQSELPASNQQVSIP